MCRLPLTLEGILERGIQQSGISLAIFQFGKEWVETKEVPSLCDTQNLRDTVSSSRRFKSPSSVNLPAALIAQTLTPAPHGCLLATVFGQDLNYCAISLVACFRDEVAVWPPG